MHSSLIRSLLSTLMLVFLYILGSIASAILGNSQRGGVSWGISVSILLGLFFVISFTQNIIINRSHDRALVISVIAFILFVVSSFALVGNNFTNSGWSHPYRFVYFQLCSFVIIIIPAVKQLTGRSSGTPRRRDAP